MGTVTVEFWQECVDSALEFIDQVGQFAEIQTRDLLPAAANSFEQRIVFTTFATIDKMAFTTPNGKTTFANVAVERKMTDVGYFEYQDNITSEMYVLFDGNRYEILAVKDIGEIKGVLKLALELTGSGAKEASKS